MASTIENFIIGVGLEYDKQGERSALSAIGAIKSKALQLAAVMGTGLGFKSLTIDAANNAAALSRFSTAIGVSQRDITAFGSAIQQEGGSLEESISLLQTFIRLQDDLQKELRPELFGDLSRIGVDPNLLLDVKNAENAERAIAAVIKGIQGLTPETQRKALQVIGAESQALLLTAQKGIQNYENVVGEALTRLRTDADFGKDAERFNQEFLKLTESIGSISREISGELVPAITPAITAMNEFVMANREFISSGIENTTKFVADNFKEIAIAIGAIAGYGAFKTGKGLLSLPGKLADSGRCCPDKGGSISGKRSGKGGVVSKLGKAGGLIGLAAQAIVISDTLADAAFERMEKSQLERAKKSQFGVFSGEPIAQKVPLGMPIPEFISRPATYQPYLHNQDNRPIITKSYSNNQDNRPIQVNATLTLDGEVISRQAIKAMQYDNNKTLSEFETSTGG